jgi:hypothetical protein
MAFRRLLCCLITTGFICQILLFLWHVLLEGQKDFDKGKKAVWEFCELAALCSAVGWVGGGGGAQQSAG